VVRREVAAAKAGRARGWLNDAAATLLTPLDAFLSDPKAGDLALFYLFLAIQESIDLTRSPRGGMPEWDARASSGPALRPWRGRSQVRVFAGPQS